MKASDLNLYFSNSLQIADFVKRIDPETSNYIDLVSKTGATIPLHFDEDEAIYINNSSLSKLIADLTDNDYNLAILSYICDCLTLGDDVDFSNATIKEITFDLADPEINGSLTKETISTILNLLK